MQLQWIQVWESVSVRALVFHYTAPIDEHRPSEERLVSSLFMVHVYHWLIRCAVVYRFTAVQGVRLNATSTLPCHHQSENYYGQPLVSSFFFLNFLSDYFIFYGVYVLNDSFKKVDCNSSLVGAVFGASTCMSFNHSVKWVNNYLKTF